jgi:hypothetical protein
VTLPEAEVEEPEVEDPEVVEVLAVPPQEQAP